VSDVKGYERISHLDGKSPFIWRQGLKHDCSKIMELKVIEGTLVNGYGEIVEVENEWVYWLLKSSDLRAFEAEQARKKVIVTQRRLGKDTENLQNSAPKLWQYLTRNSQYLDSRKSSIYRSRPRFSIFGIGDYSFKPYKVAISGFYKQPRFSLVLPMDNRPVMLDDTCYLLGFDTYLDVLFTASVLNSQPVQQFLQTLVFADAKRPYTKHVLMRIDLARASNQLSLQDIYAFWASMDYKPLVSVTESDYQEYKQRLSDMREETQISQLRLGI